MRSSVQLRRATSSATANGFHQPPEASVRRVCLTRGMHVPEHVAMHHTHELGPDQCCSAVVQTIHAPPERVWSVVRRFDNPQAYKSFVRRCHVVSGDGLHVGDLREVQVVSGLPAGSSTERLEILDEERHVISFSVVGGDHRLHNYRSVTTLHVADGDDGGDTVVVESYVVDVPPGNTPEETLSFVDTIVRCNLQSLARSTAMR
ncbi:PREDICTED: abscisic acid receptor PYL5-like [Tarenaya hassleriana]|uniref:abscisic acid receptor PYL5-like n=1 Tax=Tarenaya hassleriana TaxID=28532 RepID=UPI00053C0A4C|nr:PREDICTED: abscisic acid receptor PYL5-like [Tarenaya hassleriana]